MSPAAAPREGAATDPRTDQAFDSPTYEPLAQLGVEVEWNPKRLLRPADIVYQPRFNVSSCPVAAVRARGRAREEAGEADARPRPAPRR